MEYLKLFCSYCCISKYTFFLCITSYERFDYRGAKNGALPPIERPDSAETISSLAKDQTRSPVRHTLTFSDAFHL